MSISSQLEAWSREDLELAVKVMVLIAGCVFALVLLAYFIRFGPLSGWLFGPETTEQVANAKAAWGQLGDFVGGSLNPILSGLTLIGLVFTILLQQEAMQRTQDDSNRNLLSLQKQTALSLIAARLKSLAAALDVISEMHSQALQMLHPSSVELGRKKEQIADEILEINESLRNTPTHV
jgi:hypothetical protein